MNAVRPGKDRGGYTQEYSDFTDGLTSADRALLPDMERVQKVHLEGADSGPAAFSQDPLKVQISGAKSGGGAPGFSSKSPEFTPSNAAASATATDPMGFPPHMMPFGAYDPTGQGMFNPMAMGMGAYGMPPYGMPGMDPNMFAAMGMGGKGGMPFMPMPGMFPGMMSPMGGMPPGMMGQPGVGGGGKGGGKGGEQGAGKEKTRERRRRKNKSNKAADEAPEGEEENVVRSDELNEVRKAGQGKCKLTLEQVLPQAIEFAADQHGSRFLQTKMEESTDAAEKLAAYEAILPQTKLLSKDQFGNFVIQKLFDIGTTDQKRRLADHLEGDVLALAQDQHGCRVIQKAIQLLPRDAQTKLAEELGGKVDECIQNMHGNHVIQKCIEQMPPDSVNFIIYAVCERVEFMAEHMYGCRVIQRLLEHCAPHQLQEMLQKIEACTEKLSQNLYGNYVVQHMLEHGRAEDKKRILQIVANNIMEFAKNKCSSNVVEKCFEIATIGEHADALKDDRAKLFSALLDLQPGQSMTPLQQLADDRFGNYIVQRMLEHSRGTERDKLKQQLLAQAGSIQASTNGKHILSALQKEFGIDLQPGETQ